MAQKKVEKKVEKTGLNLYRVTFYFHTYGSVDVKASSEEEALEMADGGDIANEELIENLQEDSSPDAELVEKNVLPDVEEAKPEGSPKMVKIELTADEMFVAENMYGLASHIENDDILEPLYEGEVSEVVVEEYNAKFTIED